jgi:hypothetical protein
MDAPSIVRWIDWVRDGSERPDEALPSSFIRIPYAGRFFLCSMEMGRPFGGYPDSPDEFWHPQWWLPLRRVRALSWSRDDFAGWFAMEEKAAEGFLNALSAIVQNGRDNLPEFLQLPRLDPTGFGFGGDDAVLGSPDSEYRYLFIEMGLRCSAARRRAEWRGTGRGFQEKACEWTDRP